MKDSTTYYPIVESKTQVTFFPDDEGSEDSTETQIGSNKKPKTLTTQTEEVSILLGPCHAYINLVIPPISVLKL